MAESSEEVRTPPERALLIGVLGMTLALRLLHLSSALHSPLTYQPGPDEDYYLRLGQAVAAGQGHGSADLLFMDPGYGYLLGALFKLTGVNPAAVYALQLVIDTATAGAVFLIGQLLSRPRAGLIGAALYGLTSTAIMFSTALLKETWVTGFLTWWVVGGLALLKTERKLAWVAFGVMCGAGVALRSTLWEMSVLTLLLPFAVRAPERRTLQAGTLSLVAAAGILLGLAPWSMRNEAAIGRLSPLPINSGIVLHQAYNKDNPDSSIWIPPFVSYSHPGEIWRGYSAEASRRAGRPLSPVEIDRFWRDQAWDYMASNPTAVARAIAFKALTFLSASEIPNNRYSNEERMFSPVLRVLPSPSPWLLALGLAGLVWLAFEDRRWLLVAAPIATAWITFALFWAEDRFRIHAAGALAFCAGYFVDRFVSSARGSSRVRPYGLAMLVVTILALSTYLGIRRPPPAVRWDHIVWGYIKMGKLDEAQAIASRVVRDQPMNGPLWEALGFTAAVRQQYGEARTCLERAISLRPQSHVAHYNLARTYLALGDREHAAEQARIAFEIDPLPEYKALLARIEKGD